MGVDQRQSEIEFVRYYLDQTWQEMRHMETLRVAFSSSVATISLAASGLLVSRDVVDVRMLALFAIVLAAIGALGFLGTQRLTVLHDWDQARMDAWHEELARLIGDRSVLDTRDRVDEAFWDHRPTRLRHRHIWLLLGSLPIGLGGVLLGWAVAIG
ncbi:MAG: hypothetical protein WBA45_12735 [Microthrixaceae bacterium]